jgi:orotate phosphoribosyltransferase
VDSASVGAANARSATIEELFRHAGAIRNGHFLLKSGRHAERYLEKFLVLQHPAIGVEIARRMADALTPYRPTLVVGPTTGGVILSFEVARLLADLLRVEVRAAFAEPIPAGGRALRRGWHVDVAERVVLVDDILTTGASVRETAEAVRAAGAGPLAVAVIVDRSTDPLELGIPLHALDRLEIPSWPADACPACARGDPLARPGSG